ncbi:tyrosine-type recombinase/integrase [Micromonospora sp. DT229]|uniref:tyrosine-type recombinase/integrase n=1 Tax=Micromonospora sp. DT229 TaxID=3393430 RepID=UPI003CE78344
MTSAAGRSLSSGEVEAARLILARLGITPEQLLSPGDVAPPPSREMPTFTEYIDRVADAVTPGTRRVYDSYWRRVRDAWGDRRLNEPTPLEVKQLSEQVKTEAIVRSNSRGGRTASEHLISALRCLYKYAVADRLIDETENPALRVAKPRRLASTRRALPEKQLAQLFAVAGSTGNDPELDSLILRLHAETACRRGGALALRPCDLDAVQCLVRLSEKGETVRWQPISPTLAQHLLLHVEERGDGDRKGELLRYRNGNPITSRRYDHLFQRLGLHLPWVATQQVTAHWLRHTTLTWVERNFGYAVARAFAGHDGKSDAGTTSTYVRADVYEVAQALAALTGESHPLAEHKTEVDGPEQRLGGMFGAITGRGLS